MQSALDPAGPAGAIIAEITWVLFGGGALIFAGVMALAAYAVFSSKRARLSSHALILGGGIAFPVVVLSALLVYSLLRMETLEAAGEPAARIEVTGEQWWWRVRYPDFETANEIRIPVGRPVELVLKSADVIHSFWVPALAGKLDMIPGRENVLRVRADRAGEFRGQCAEYCGGPHAFMALFVVALPAEEYDAWVARQRSPAPGASDSFLKHCAGCHTVRGTPAAGVRGPDLTHVGGRLTLGAALLPMNRGALAGWIASSQHIKPGNLMPSFGMLPGEELNAIAEYLEGLK
jgi:cytochrome c oxidase subunit II